MEGGRGASNATRPDGPPDILAALQERAKELSCLYRVHEICNRPDSSLDQVFHEVVDVIPAGFQHPAECFARITVDESVYEPAAAFRPGGPGDGALGAGSDTTSWVLTSPIRVQGEAAGKLEVYYRRAFSEADEGPFLKDERRLADTIAELLGQLLLYRRLLDPLQSARRGEGRAPVPPAREEREEWWVILDFLRKTDPHLLVRISRRMINYLSWNGVTAAQDLLPRSMGSRRAADEATEPADENRPLPRQSLDGIVAVIDETFKIAEVNLASTEIHACIRRWIRDDRSAFLIEAVEHQGTTLAELSGALERYHQDGLDDRDLSRTIQVELRASLVRRFLTDHLDYINIAKSYVEGNDFYDLSRHVIYPANGHGKVGGKAAGLFLGAQIIKRSPEYADTLGSIKTPKTWYVSSDGVLDFIEFNQLGDLYDRKYLEIDQVRREYPHIIQVFKNSHFSPEIVRGLSLALDDFEEKPLVVRSSSLLEDRVGSAFSGKYKSLFLANQGTKTERLNALMDAIAEVYASIFGPDPIEYRAERGLLDVHEEMGILIQEVVGTKVGRYFLPTFAGVAFSHNELRWSPRIKRDDGLLRLVPGLGTRAVDRLGDDYPVLVSPGQPGLRVNVTAEEVARYAPRKVDVIDLETRRFETLDMRDLLQSCGAAIPGIQNLVSVCEDGGLHRPGLLDWETKLGKLVVTFEGLVSRTPFMTQMRTLLKLLVEKSGGPVDIEFASDGKDIYLLQYRPQSSAEDAVSTPIPRDIPEDRVVFTAGRYVSNGKVPDLTHIVYVDPAGYARIGNLADLKRVARAVGRLNKVLPKRQFVLMGPGRWGSRGDIKLGVAVTYSDIHNTSLLIEVARKLGNYVPDLSFGTHFFQDLVEASIRYLPLFPDEAGIQFNETFLTTSPNVLVELLPEFADLGGSLRVIDVPKATGGLILRVALNADLDQAVGYLASPGASVVETSPEKIKTSTLRVPSAAVAPVEDHSRWRLRMAERLARTADAQRLGIAAIYVFGSTKNGTATASSDLDLLVHFRGSDEQRCQLLSWLEGWSQALSEANLLRAGVETKGLLDVQLLTDQDIALPTSYAAKIGAVTDAARPLALGGA